MKTKGLSAVLAFCAFGFSLASTVQAEINVTSRIKVPLQSSTYDKKSATTTNTYFLKNSSTTRFSGPFKVVVESLNNRDVALVNPDGYTLDGKPYYEYAEPSLGPLATTAVKAWNFQQRCGGKKVSATLKPYNSTWQIAFQGACSPLVTVYVSVLASEGGANHTPVADAGPDQTVKAGQVIPLDGSLSTDEDGNPLTYRWSVVSKPTGSRVTLAGATSVRPTVKFTMGGTYVLGLTVGDGTLTSARDTCTLSTSNSRPVAEAGPDQTVPSSATVRLDSSGSTDVDGNRLSYAWSIVSMPPGSAAVLDSPSAVRPSFTADTPGEYVVQLVVSHGLKMSFPNFCRISTVNSLPRANAGADRMISQSGDMVRLDGAGSSDVDGDPLVWRWAMLSKPAGSAAAIAEPGSVRPSFTADVPGTYIAQLVVNDGRRDGVPDTVAITTENVRPVADAGRDQTAGFGGKVTLDGSGSHGSDPNALTWKWAFLAVPKGSLARLSNATVIGPSFTADKKGTYVVQLVVSDVTLKGLPDTVVIDTENSRPVADAGSDRDADTNTTVTLDGRGSVDPDGVVLSPFWAMLFRPAGSTAVLSDPAAMAPEFFADVSGTYVLQLIVRDDALASEPDSVVITAAARMVAVPNVVGMTQAAAESAITTALLRVGTVTTAHSGTVPAGSVISQDPAAGASVVAGSAVALLVSLGPEVFTVPDVVGLPRAAAESAIGAAGLILGTVTQQFSETVPAGAVISQSPLAGTIVSAGSAVSLVLSRGPVVIPPDPSTVAPPLDQTVASALFRTTEFLYTGANPIQTGVAPGTMELKRAAVIRGKVLTLLGDPLAGATISILNHPEFGQTLSRADGMFDMVVNGGGLLTVSYEKAGLLPAQRQLTVPWQDFAIAPDVVLIALDSKATAIAVNATDVQVHQGSTVTDADGTRTATLLFPPGTGASMTLPNGTLQPLTELHVRATEFTVGDKGPNAMPGELPPSSGYTYAMELSADEAVTAGATSVTLSQPLSFYLENFLGFPVGSLVPTGFYDRGTGRWVASDNGRVIQVLSITNGSADLDLDGDGVLDGAAALAALGISDVERQRLAALYLPGQSLWRVLISHFTPWDCNWPYGPPTDAVAPGGGDNPKPVPKPDKQPDKQCNKTGSSTIGCQSQTLGEAVGITGTPFELHYRSNRVPGRVGSTTLPIRLSGATLPPDLQRIHVVIRIAGREIKETLAPSPNLTYTFTWDRKDVYGRTLQGSQPVSVRIGFEYLAQYYATSDTFAASFNRFGLPPIYTAAGGGGGGGGGAVVFSRLGMRTAAPTIVLWKDFQVSMGRLTSDLGGWSLSVHHDYDVWGRTLYLGNGDQRSAAMSADVITTVAGTGLQTSSGDGGPATQAGLMAPRGVAAGPDGSLYISELFGRIRRVGPDGIITTAAGTGVLGFSGDGGPATQAMLGPTSGVAVGRDGSLYIAENARIRRVGPDGIITTVAGNGSQGFSGDGGPATQAMLGLTYGVGVGPDGSLYIADSQNARIRRVGPDGIITTVVGTGGYFSGDGGPATRAGLAFVWGLAVGSDGSLYLSESARIRRVGPDGIITTVVGNGIQGFSGDGGPATQAMLGVIYGVAVGPDGSLYISDGQRIRHVGPGGIITTMAGKGDYGSAGDSGPATQALLGTPMGGAVGPDGSLYFAEYNGQRIRQIRSPLPGSSVADISIAAEDGREVYVFNSSGRHLRTFDTLTGAIRFQFSYDSAAHLVAVTDGDGNVTAIERDGSANPTAIVAPGGQRTALTVNADGYLASVADPAGGTVHLASNTGVAEGLLATLTDSRNHVHSYAYDSLGRLVRDENPAGGVTTLARNDLGDDHYSVTMTTALGLVSTYEMEDLSNGDTRRVRIDPSGARTESLIHTDGSRRATYPDGTIADLVEGPDPRFGMQAPLLKSLTIATPGGLTETVAASRSVSLSDPNNIFSLTTQTDSITVNGRSTTRQYDGLTRKITLTTPEGRVLSSTWDDKGKLAVLQPDVNFGLDSLLFSYDTAGRLSQLQQSSQSWGFGYDAKNRLITVNDAAGRAISYAYDSADRPSTFTQPNGAVFGFSYDANGNLTHLTSPNLDVHMFDYTAVDLVSTLTPPGSGAFVSTYDTDKRLISHSLPSHRTNIYSYDGAGRPAGVSLPEAVVGIGYKAGDATRRMDSIARTATVGGLTQAVAYGYDGGLKTGMTWTGATEGQYAYTYDNDFLLTSSTLTSGTDTVSIALTRDGDGLPTAIGPFTFVRSGPRGNPTQISDGALTISLVYDTLGRITGRTYLVAGQPMYDAQFLFDGVGRITRKTETLSGAVHVYDYGYDANSQLTEVRADGSMVERYGYDANGNRSSRQIGSAPAETASFDTQGRLAQQGTVTYGFDDDGFLMQRNSDLFQYSSVGELLAADVGGTVIHYGYDGLRRLVSVSKPGGNTVQYFYGNPGNDLQVTHARDSLGVLTTYYYDDGGRLFALQRGASRYYVATDQLGSPRLVVDPAGTVVKILSYDGFGNVALDTNPTFELPIGFAGGLADNATGFVRFGFRDYDPRTGRWLARDPIRFARGDGNLYVYLMNNPINGVDLSGLGTSIGGSAYDGIGGGFKITFDDKGLSFCGEVGFGIGTSFGFDRNASLDNKMGIVAEIGASLGVVGGAKVTGEVYAGFDCGELTAQLDSQGCALGICAGETVKGTQNGADKTTSLDSKNANADLDPKALLEAKQKIGASGKVAAQLCKSLSY